MPKLYKNVKLIIPVALMALLASLTLTSIRYQNDMLGIFTSGLYDISHDAYFITYALEILGPLAFPILALVSIVVLFTSSRKGLLTIAAGLTALFGFLPHLLVNLYLLLFRHVDFTYAFFETRDWMTGEFDLTLALYHAASYMALPVFLLYLALSRTKTALTSLTFAPIATVQPASPQVIVGYNTTTGAPIYGDSK